MRLHHKIHRREGGQVLIIGVFCLIVMMGFVSLTIDIGLFLEERRDTQNAVDAGALAGAQVLPDDGVGANALALQWASKNENGTNFESVDVSFRCVVGDRNGDGQPDAGDVPAVCNPGSATFKCQNGRCAALCAFNAPTHRCNTIVVSASKDVPFHFAPVLSILDGSSKCIYDSCSTGGIAAVACRGVCGAPPNEPLDVVMIMDRTSSMSATELANAKNGALEALKVFNPQYQQIALGVLGPSSTTTNCSNGGRGISTTSSTARTWQPVPFSTNYQSAGGALNTSSLLVRTINCLNSSSVGTNLGEPTKAARQYLQSSGRGGVRKVIILFTDGAANEPAGNRPCNYANNEATNAKNAGVEVYTIGYGLEVELCSESGSPYNGVRATRLLADMATNSQDDHGGCTGAGGAAQENADGDHFLCQPTSGDLSTVFRQVAVQIVTGGSFLISIPE